MAHLVVVDDAPEILQIVRILCRRAGHALSCHPDGESLAAALSQERRPDLILLDLHLPGEGGIELSRRLARSGGPLAGVTTALFTQGAAGARLAEALEAGIDFLVGKELLGRPDEWNQRLNEVLELARTVPACLDGDKGAPPPGVAERIQRALQHPVLLRHGEEIPAALARRALVRALENQPLSDSAVDVWSSSATLSAYLTRLADRHPDVVARLVQHLGRQAECLLGRAAAAPFRAALIAPLP